MLNKNKMSPEQLVKGNELNEKLKRISKTKARIKMLSLSWQERNCTYWFNKNELGTSKLEEIFEDVTQVASALLEQKINQYEAKIEKELKEL